MPKLPTIDIIIPAYNEANAIGRVLADLPREQVRHILVCDNGSTDSTPRIAQEAGATVLHEPQKGYGSACLRGLAHLETLETQPDIVVFLDGDYSDYPQELPLLIAPILANTHDLVIGSRVLGKRLKGALQPQQIFGNWLASKLLHIIYNYHFTDLGPFRAIRYEALQAMNMQDRDFGWTVEMQVKAAKMKLRCCEVPVSYRPRIGTSKVSGTLKGSFLAGYKILYTLFKYRHQR